jgi:hypothetical protein
MGVARAVYLSVYDIRQDVAEDLGLESGPIKAAIEAALARSGLNWTVLGCAPSMQLFFAMIRGEIAGQVGDHPLGSSFREGCTNEIQVPLTLTIPASRLPGYHG